MIQKLILLLRYKYIYRQLADLNQGQLLHYCRIIYHAKMHLYIAPALCMPKGLASITLLLQIHISEFTYFMDRYYRPIYGRKESSQRNQLQVCVQTKGKTINTVSLLFSGVLQINNCKLKMYVHCTLQILRNSS